MTMDCLVQQPIWTGGYHHGGLASLHSHYFTPYYFPRKRTSFSCSYFSGSYGLPSRLDDDVAFPTDIKLERTDVDCTPEEDKEYKICVVCGERASGYYFGALVCLPCKSFYIRCTKDGEPTFTCQCNGNCDIAKQGRIRCQYCRYQRCLIAGMCRKEKPETVQPADGQVLCKVCGDIANGIHFGVNTCEGCKKFFRRGLVENQSYICKSEKICTINPRNRNNCRYCRYQKCIGVGMSREAIKMGRPKKAESSESNSSANIAEAPESPHISPVPSPPINFSPGSSPRRSHVLDSNTFDLSKVKSEPQSCEFTELSSTTGSSTAQMNMPNPMYTTSAQSFNQSYPSAQSRNVVSSASTNLTWTQNQRPEEVNWLPDIGHTEAQQTMMSNSMTSQAQRMMSVNSSLPSQPASHTNSSVVYEEDDMDDILAYLNQEPATEDHKRQGDQQQYQGHSPMPQPCINDNPNFPMPSAKQLKQQINDYNSQILQSDGYHQLNVDTSSPSLPPCSSGSYPNSPYQYGQGSPNHYSENSPEHTTQFNANSPSCMPTSPPYQQRSSYSPCQYQNSTADQYHPNSPLNSCHSPPSASQNYPHSPVTSQNYPHSPASSPNYPHSPAASPNYPQSPAANQIYSNSPTANSYTHSSVGYGNGQFPQSGLQQNFGPGGQDKESIYLDMKAQMRINQMFMNCETDILPIDNCGQSSKLTRDQLDANVVFKSLQNYRETRNEYESSPRSSPESFHNSSDDSSNDSYSYPSCGQKRKTLESPQSSFVQSNVYYTEGQKDFHCENYSMMKTLEYWNKLLSFNPQTRLTEDMVAFTNHILAEYNVLRDIYDEGKQESFHSLKTQWPNFGKETNHWDFVQRRVIRNIMAFMNFAKTIPGFDTVDLNDVAEISNISNFSVALIMAASEFYDSEQKKFQYFWNWTVSPNNPVYFFKLRLLQCGEKINQLCLSRMETAFLCTLSLFSTDFLNLRNTAAIENIRHKLIYILQAHLYSQGIDPVKRLQEIFTIMPEVRHLSTWHKQLMKKMTVNLDIQEVHLLFDELNLQNNQTHMTSM